MNSLCRSIKSKEIYDVTGIYFISPYKNEPNFLESIGIKEFNTPSKTT